MLNKMDLLAEVTLFSHLNEKELLRIAELTSVHFFRKGEAIIREGERDRRLFIVVRGEVEIVKGLGSKYEWHIRVLGPRSHFGEMALIDDLPRSASVVAKEETEILRLDQRDLRSEIEKHPSIALELMKTLSRRIREIEAATEKALSAILLLE